MKKIYIKPTVTQHIIVGRQPLLSGSATFSEGLGSTNASGNDALSRQFDSIWDDDEE